MITIKNKIRYYANGFTYKLEQENDNWWSIYKYNDDTGEYYPQLQAKDLKHAQSWCDLHERVPVAINRLC
ncbi:hypothetical protein [Clostridium sp. KNHs214]|uniref:hypothetical protein n=1 Tax=Clostridium sp. KNHs214 TaxID=1540257 RepID=UPI00054D549A|nr:hypothetical protein [Clostridium sp. KNHs214]